MEDLKDFSSVNILINVLGLNKFVFNDFKEAKESGEVVSVVLVDEDDSYDLYVVGTDKEGFYEYVSWRNDEIKEDPDLIKKAWGAITDVIKQPTKYDKIDKALTQYGWNKNLINEVI